MLIEASLNPIKLISKKRKNNKNNNDSHYFDRIKKKLDNGEEYSVDEELSKLSSEEPEEF